MQSPTFVITHPRVSTFRRIPENGSAWKGRLQVALAQSSAPETTLVRVLNWAGWLALLALPIGIMVWSARETPEQARIRVQVQAVMAESSR